MINVGFDTASVGTEKVRNEAEMNKKLKWNEMTVRQSLTKCGMSSFKLDRLAKENLESNTKN